MSKFLDLIDTLSKSSPNAVFTPENINKSFKYLYVTTLIEDHFIQLLNNKKDQKSIIFLCGSSGDGKSAVIGRNYKGYEEYYNIHIDATHSFRPDQSAIEALDDVFSMFKVESKSLIVGINMGILLNYAKEGSSEHDDIKIDIEKYDLEKKDSEMINFLNFEDYPKFEMSNDLISSTFIERLLNKITMPSLKNPFYKAFIDDLDKDTHRIEHKNFYLLSNKAIQSSLIELLVTVHLKYDQFLTSRSILDLIHILIKGPRLLIDQLFESDSNSILENIKKEDPLLYRTKQLDTFVLERSNKKSDLELENFVSQFNNGCKIPILSIQDPHTLIRTFFLFKNSDCSTNYHKIFSDDFNDSSTFEFVKLIIANHNYNSVTKKTIHGFYTQIRKAIFSYANKKRPALSEEDLFCLDTINNYDMCVHLDIDPDIKSIQNDDKYSINTFKCYLMVNGSSIEPIIITLNIYKMILAINKGYRPNKHDRNTIVIFEELLEKIADKIKDAKKLVFIKNNKRYLFKNNLDDIKVSVNDN